MTKEGGVWCFLRWQVHLYFWIIYKSWEFKDIHTFRENKEINRSWSKTKDLYFTRGPSHLAWREGSLLCPQRPQCLTPHLAFYTASEFQKQKKEVVFPLLEWKWIKTQTGRGQPGTVPSLKGQFGICLRWTQGPWGGRWKGPSLPRAGSKVMLQD